MVGVAIVISGVEMALNRGYGSTIPRVPVLILSIWNYKTGLGSGQIDRGGTSDYLTSPSQQLRK